MFSGSANIHLPYLDKFVSKPIPTYCQSINIVGKLWFVLFLLFSGPYLTHIWEIQFFSVFPGPDLALIRVCHVGCFSWLALHQLTEPVEEPEADAAAPQASQAAEVAVAAAAPPKAAGPPWVRWLQRGFPIIWPPKVDSSKGCLLGHQGK